MATTFTPDQIKQFMLMQQQMQQQQQPSVQVVDPTGGHAAQTPPGAFKDPYSEPALKFERDEYGCMHYVGPIPGLEPDRAHLYTDYGPHIPYIFYTAKGKNKHDGNVVYMNQYKDAGIPMRVQLCDFNEVPLRAPFGAQVGKSKDGKELGDLNRPNFDLTLENKALEDFLAKLDEKTLNIATARIERWFKPGSTEATARALYKPLVTPPGRPKEGAQKRDYKPTVRTKVTLGGDNPTRVFIKTGEENGNWIIERVPPNLVTYDLLKKGTRCIPIVDILGVWFMGVQYGISLSCVDLIMVPFTERKQGDFRGMDGLVVREPRPPASAQAQGEQQGEQQVCGQNLSDMYENGNGEDIDPSMYMANAVPDGNVDP